MLDWDRRAIELATMVAEYSRTRNVMLRKPLFEYAKALLKLREKEIAARGLFWKWHNEPNKKRAAALWASYLALVREVNAEADSLQPPERDN